MASKMLHAFGCMLLIVIECLGYQHGRVIHRQYDGWFNNLAHIRWGSVGDSIVYNVMPAYADRTYKMATTHLPSARDVSNLILSGPSGLPSYHNNTVLFVFFGQTVAYDIVHMTEPSCPVELIQIPVSEHDPDFGKNGSKAKDMLFIRSAYDYRTGSAPNNPRKPTNAATSWIDGSFIYGLNNVWANNLRSFKGGRLKTDEKDSQFPALNNIGIPLKKFPHPTKLTMINTKKLWRFGDSHAHQHPGLTAVALVWFRFHNHVAEELQRHHPEWRDELLFTKARMKVVAVMQNIAMYEWLPQLLRESPPAYTGYNGCFHPGISATFQGAAFHLLHSMIPTGLYIRDAECKYQHPLNETALRLCKVYWNAQEALQKFGVDDIIRGMASQIAEREDHVLVSDLRANMFGPRQETRRDMVVLSLMRGRDHGLPDYNTARRVYGLQPISDWHQLNPQLYTAEPEVFARLERLYGNVSNLEVLPAAFLESTAWGPGPLSRAVLREQFLRLRDGDRFWFENTADGYFTEKELEEIRNITFHDVITTVTGVRDGDIQKEAFVWRHGDPCPQPEQLRGEGLGPCREPGSFDYFEGSEVAFIMSFGAIFLYPAVCVCLVFLIHKCDNAYIRRSTQNKFRRRSSARTRSESDSVTWDARQRSERKRLDSTSSMETLERIRLDSTSSMDFPVETLGRIRLDSTSSMDFPEKSTDGLPSVTGSTDGLPSVTGSAAQKTLLKRRSSTPFAPVGHFCVKRGPSDSRKGVHHSGIPAANTRTFTATEVRSRSRPPIPVSVTMLLSECVIEVSSGHESSNRSLNLLQTATCDLFYSRERTSHLLALRMSEHPDLCLRFTTREDLELFRVNIRHMFSSFWKPLAETESHDAGIFEQLVPRKRAEQLLAKSLMLAFAEEPLETVTLADSEVRILNLIMQYKISKDRLCRLMSMVQDTSFLSHIFATCDRQATGLISYLDICFYLIYLEKGPGDHTRTLLLEMLDFVTSDELDNTVIASVVRSVVSLWSPTYGLRETKIVLDQVHAHLGPDSPVHRPRFKEALQNTEWFNSIRSTYQGQRRSASQVSVARTLGLHTLDHLGRLEPKSSPTWKRVVSCAPIRKRCYEVLYNNLAASLIVFIFYYLCFLLFAERFYEYAVELEGMGARRLTGYGISVTRGAAAGMSFCYSVLLLTMCRNCFTVLRQTVLNNFVPFDLNITFHKLVAWTALVFTGMHVVGYAFNVYHLATQPSLYLCLLNGLKPGATYNVTDWLYGNLTGMTGVLLVFILGIIYTFATQTARKYVFNVFWVTHKLFYVVYLLILLHGASRLLQDPSFPYYFVGPAVLFIVDKTVALSRKCRETAVLAVDFLPSNVFEIKLGRHQSFDYKSGQYVRLASLGLNNNEYHPFTLTSAPHETTLSAHIRQVGPWTATLAAQLTTCRDDGTAIPHMYIDGPYGAGQQDWNRYAVSILIGAGIGVTPYASILKDIAHVAKTDSWYRVTCKKVYFVWVTPNLGGWEWFVDILRLVEQADVKNVIEIQIFITKYAQSLSLSDVMLYICETRQWRDKGKSLFTGLQSAVSFGRPSFSDILMAISRQWPKLRKLGVFSCGTPTMTSAASKACHTAGVQSKTTFEHHCENFY